MVYEPTTVEHTQEERITARTEMLKRAFIYVLVIALVALGTTCFVRAQNESPVMYRLGSRGRRAASATVEGIEGTASDIIGVIRGFIGDGTRKQIDDKLDEAKEAIKNDTVKIAFAALPIGYAAYLRSRSWVMGAAAACVFATIANPSQITAQSIAGISAAVWVFKGLDIASIVVAVAALALYAGGL